MKKSKTVEAPTKLPKKLEKVWVAWMIDTAAGPHLMMLGMRYPQKAEKLQQILANYINDYYKKDIVLWRQNPENFVKACFTGVAEIVGLFTVKQLTAQLINGMPKTPNIITSVKRPIKLQ